MIPFPVERLEAAARLWVGTPFCERGAVRGAGVSCHRLCLAVYRDAGWLPEIEVPNAPVGWARAQTRSLMAEWLDGDGLPWFAPVRDLGGLLPGDLLGFRIGHCIHHLAVLLSGGQIVSSVETRGVRISPCIQPPWLKRLERAWRPVRIL